MKKVIKLTESDLARIVKRVIKEQQTPTPTRPANPATPPTGVQLKYTDGQSYPTKLSLTNNQDKLDSFLDWGAPDRLVAAKKLISNGYPVNQNTLNAAEGNDVKINPQTKQEVKMSEDEFMRLRTWALSLQEMINIGLATIAKYFANPQKTDYMPTVYAQIDKILPQTINDWNKYYEGKKPSSQLDTTKFSAAFKNIVNQQLEKVQG